MSAPVVFPFKVSGEKDVVEALNSITRAANRYKATAEDAFEKAAKAAAVSAAKTKAAAEDGSKSNLKAAEAAKKSYESASTAAIKASQRLTDKILDNNEKQARSAEKANERAVKSAEKAAEAQAKAADKISARKSKVEGKANDKFVSGIAGAAGGMALGAAVAGLGVIGAAAREAVSLDEKARRIAVNSRGYGEKLTDVTALKNSFENTAIAHSVNSADVAAGTETYVSKTGNLKDATKFQDTFATIANASGAKIEDIANAAAELSKKFDITSIKDMQEALAQLTFQGKAGSFEIKDAATQYARLAAAAGSFNIGKGTQAVAVLGGLTQIAKEATGSPEAAATAVESMFSNLTKNNVKLSGLGVKVFNKDGSSRNIMDILPDLVSKVGGNDLGRKKAGLETLLGEQGIRAINPLIATFQDAFLNAKKGGSSDIDANIIATKALRDAQEKATNAASSFAEAELDELTIRKSASAQLDQAWEKIKQGVSDKLVPMLTESLPGILTSIIPATLKVIAAFGAFVTFLKDHFPGLKAQFDAIDKKDKLNSEINNEKKILDKAIDDRKKSKEHRKLAGPLGIDQDTELNTLVGLRAQLDSYLTPEDQNDFMSKMRDSDREGFKKLGKEKSFDENVSTYDDKYKEAFNQLNKDHGDISNIDMSKFTPEQQGLIIKQSNAIETQEKKAAALDTTALEESTGKLTKNVASVAEVIDIIAQMRKNFNE